MTDSALLAELAALAGIAPSYRDVWQSERPTSDATRRALLAAMGIDVASDAAIRSAITERRALPWRRLLPPVRVMRARERPQVPLTVTAADLQRPHHWRLESESGRVHAGELVPAELAQRASATVDGETRHGVTFELPLDPGLGYHDLAIEDPAGRVARTRLIVCPATCHVPPRLARGERVWGLAVQLYALRSPGDWGMGDFGSLTELTGSASRLGADAIGLNPLHALYPHAPDACAPYSPSSRLFLNVLYIDPAAVPELEHSRRARALMEQPDFHARLEAARAAELVDYPAVAALKRPVLEALYATFRRRHLGIGSARGRAFDDFRARAGEDLRRHALHEALGEHFAALGEAAGASWPPAYHDPGSPEVADFAAEHGDRVEFFEYLQWLADEQLQAAARAAGDSGLAIGLYRDLAISVGALGAEPWARPELYARGASVGSPPDDFNLYGQDWGLPPMIPQRLVEEAYRPFIATLRNNMRHAGALRIDHAMGLMRLYWVPQGCPADQGAYVHYPLEDLLGILALESRRNRCMIIGEDLGTVPDRVRETFGPAEVQSYRVLYFEKTDTGAYRAPAEYPARALASVTTHDLPPLAAFWSGHDLVLRAEMDLFPSESQHAEQIEQRARDRGALLTALADEALLPPDTGTDPDAVPHLDAGLRRSVHRYLARTPSRIMMVHPEDVLGQRDQANLPGTVGGHPNWRRRYPLAAGDIGLDPEFRATADALAVEGRGRPAEVPVPPAAAEAAPRATYRLQLGAHLTLRDAEALVPYLDTLGISHCYLSPILQARPGSEHGYDVVDHQRIDAAIGDRDDLASLAAALHARGMGLIVDIVPNHMGVMGADNAWWLDVLENGPASRFAGYFDIDWQPARAELAGRVLLPILGDHYGIVLEAGELRLGLDPDGRALAVSYHEHRLPLDPATWPRLLGQWPERLEAALDAAALAELHAVCGALERLPARAETDPGRLAERERDKEQCKDRLAALCAAHPSLRTHLDDVCAFFNGVAGEPATFEPLHDLLETQAWRLAHWRVAGDEINYRRFFDINDLAGLRVEDEAVFEATHGLILELRAAGHLDGVRVDHPDGLHDPRAYLRRLARRLESVAPPDTTPAYRVVEKILTGAEPLPPDWPVHGTTGYDFANVAGRLLVDADGRRGLDAAYHRFVGHRVDFAAETWHARHLVMHRQMAAELATLANRLDRLSELDWKTRDFTRGGLQDALAEVIACFPVYRTYVTPDRVSAADRGEIERALAGAAATGRVDPGVLGFIRDVLQLRPGSALVESKRPELADFVMRLQQYTAALMAKGIEDTALYRYNRLCSLNEVGGDPADFAAEPGRVHERFARQARQWPHAMLATATHDAKRGEDVRARLHALSEIPRDWRDASARWRRLNQRHRRRLGNRRAPSADDEYLLYQTLVGTWPPGTDEPDAEFATRLRDYLRKAAREAKRRTSWWQPDSDYEAALDAFVDGVLGDREFLAELAPLRRRIERLGAINALAQCLLKLTAPGVPDFYQGSELGQLALVDPDNRRPVDFGHLAACLQAVRGIERESQARRSERLATLMDTGEDGIAKLFLIRRVLGLRRRLPRLFRDGGYEPLATAGTHARRVFAFSRRHGDAIAITAIPRLTAALTDGGRTGLVADAWDDTRVLLPGDSGTGLVDAVAGHDVTATTIEDAQAVTCRELFAVLPGAVLIRPVDAAGDGPG